MARPLRIEYPGAWYHVMHRGQGRRKIFLTSSDRMLFIDILREAIEIFHIEVHAYVLMDNHYHMLVHTPEEGLGRAMRHINGIYTQKFNKMHRRDGPLFRGRYRSKLIDKDEYLLEVVRYIHMNPVEVGLARGPGNYAWSSHRAYLDSRRRPDWLVVDEVLGYFGGREDSAVRAFDKFIRAGVPERFRQAIMENPVVVGSTGFKDWVYDNFLDTGKRCSREISLKQRRPRRRVDWKSILSATAFVYDVPMSSLRRKRAGQA